MSGIAALRIRTGPEQFSGSKCALNKPPLPNAFLRSLELLSSKILNLCTLFICLMIKENCTQIFYPTITPDILLIFSKH